MAINKDRLARIKELAKVLDDSITSEEIIESFKKILEFVKQLEPKLLGRVDLNVSTERQNIVNDFKKETANLSRELQGTLKELKSSSRVITQDLVDRVADKLLELDNKMSLIRDGKDSDETTIIKEVLKRVVVPKIDDSKYETLAREMRKELQAGKRIQTPARAKVQMLGDVKLTSLANNEILKYDSATKVWKNVAVGTGTGDLLADGTIPLTDNWDVGAFTIRGTQFISDIAIGTAPFVVTSTTVVTNLNVSLLEGNAASAFATALGADDNYVTDAEKTVIGNTSGTNSGDEVSADATTEGISELAIASEIDTGTDTTRIMPIDQFVASKRNIRWLVFNLVEAGTDLATATNIAGDFVSPIAGTILQSDTAPFYLYATNSTAGTNTGTGLVVDISIGGTSIMTTNKLDFDTTEKTTTTATTKPDLTTTALAVGDIITIDVDSVHDGTVAKGLILYLAVRE